MTTGPATTEVREGDLLWTPDPERAEGSNLAAFQRWLEAERGLRFAGYHELWRWSVTDLEAFWQAIWDWFGVSASAPPARALGRRAMPGGQWFPGARLNYAEHVLRRARPGTDALLHRGETTALAGMPWEELADQVRILATWLRGAGVRPGDRVVAYLPNVPQTVVAMLAATSIGAIWASCSPDFGWQGALDRFQQLQPKVLFAVDGYRHGGRDFDRREELRRILAGLPSVERVVHLALLHPSDPAPTGRGALPWEAALAGPPVPAEGFRFEQVAFDHPLWVLFSSGTTGLPKALVHGHGGILLEQLKLQAFHLDLRAGDRLLFYTTTGWMMWNFLVSSLLLGVVPVLYDGSPLHPDAGVLWRTAQDARITLLGASPAYVDHMRRAGVVPGASYDLSALRTVFPAGSPVSPECTAWFYRNVKADLWVATGSGGTDCCTGFVGGVPTLPVRAGEIQGRHLGVAAHAFDERGHSVVDQVGELVITEPMPSMPVRLWGDEDGRRYRETYFADSPGVWRHGDFFRVNQRGGCFVLGRSDATLNRHGVRIGTAEVYRALEAVEEVDDALVVCLDLPDGGSFMPLFVTLASGRHLDDAVERKIRERLRTAYSPRHVPDRIVQVAAIPLTLTGKKLEVPVRRILLGFPPDQAVSRSAMANPQALDDFLAYARTQQDYPDAPEETPMDGSGLIRSFPLPSEIADAPGAEGWQSMYPFYTRFQPEDDERFWFYNSMHFPEPMPAFDTITAEIPYTAIGANTARVFCFPTTLGIEHRIVNGRVYITAIPVLDPAEVERRLAVFNERAGYYFDNWDRLYESWKTRMRNLIAEIEAITVPELPELEDSEVVTRSTGVAQNHYVRERFHRCIDLYSKMWHHHTEFLMLGYGAYVVFFEFCKQAFPEIPDQMVARMVAGIEVMMYRPDDELRRLARLAVEGGLDDLFVDGCDPAEVLAALRGRGEAGGRWLEAFEQARDPWFHVSTGDGFYHHHRSWNDDLTVPFSALPRYVRLAREGQTLDRPTETLRQERERIAASYRDLLASEEERAAFDQMLGLCRVVFPYVEDHKFYCEHWFTSRFFQRIREFGELLARQGVLADAEDVFHLHHTEVDQALADVMLAWSAGGKPLGGAHFQPIVAERKRMLEALRQWSPPPALGPMPKALNDPAVKMLWGITAETIQAWASAAAGAGLDEREIGGYAASPGVVEGTARVVRDVNEIGQVREGEILVCPVTAPSWAPVFGKIKAAVSDIGGTMSHAAIVAREYGMPAVVGTGQATARIKTGQRLLVDGDRGVVRILDGG